MTKYLFYKKDFHNMFVSSVALIMFTYKALKITIILWTEILFYYIKNFHYFTFIILLEGIFCIFLQMYCMLKCVNP